MDKPFDKAEAKSFLSKKEQERKDFLEKERLAVLERTKKILKDYFAGQSVEIFLVGSITREYAFTERSDVDIVLKNFEGNRFAVWAELERKIDRDVEIILYEKSRFKDHIDENGLKVL